MRQICIMMIFCSYTDISTFPNIILGDRELLFQKFDGSAQTIFFITLQFGKFHYKIIDLSVAFCFRFSEIKFAYEE